VEELLKAIRTAFLDVQHVIHRHGLLYDKVAFEVEAAVMGCFPAAANKAHGHGSDRGVQHVAELTTWYGAKPFVPRHPLLLIEIGKALANGVPPYDATRGCWKVNRKRVEGRLVLGHAAGVVRTAYRPERWMAADTVPAVLGPSEPGKWFFEGSEAEPEVTSLYLEHSLPLEYRSKPGAQGGMPSRSAGR